MRHGHLGASTDPRLRAAGIEAQARLHVIPDAKLFAHEERPRAVAEALIPALAGKPVQPEVEDVPRLQARTA